MIVWAPLTFNPGEFVTPKGTTTRLDTTIKEHRARQLTGCVRSKRTDSERTATVWTSQPAQAGWGAAQPKQP